jgi:hypothetical protein
MVNSYIVLMEFVGNKLQLEVDANSEKHAKAMVRDLIKFNTIRKCKKGTLKAYLESQKLVSEIKPKQPTII